MPVLDHLNRRPPFYWDAYNAWWRYQEEQTGKKPRVQAITEWYLQNAATVWPDGDLRPTLVETKKHSKGVRSKDAIRQYFRGYRQRRRDGSPIGHGKRSTKELTTSDDDEYPSPKRRVSRRPMRGDKGQQVAPPLAASDGVEEPNSRNLQQPKRNAPKFKNQRPSTRGRARRAESSDEDFAAEDDGFDYSDEASERGDKHGRLPTCGAALTGCPEVPLSPNEQRKQSVDRRQGLPPRKWRMPEDYLHGGANASSPRETIKLNKSIVEPEGSDPRPTLCPGKATPTDNIYLRYMPPGEPVLEKEDDAQLPGNATMSAVAEFARSYMARAAAAILLGGDLQLQLNQAKQQEQSQLEGAGIESQKAQVQPLCPIEKTVPVAASAAAPSSAVGIICPAEGNAVPAALFMQRHLSSGLQVGMSGDAGLKRPLKQEPTASAAFPFVFANVAPETTPHVTTGPTRLQRTPYHGSRNDNCAETAGLAVHGALPQMFPDALAEPNTGLTHRAVGRTPLSVLRGNLVSGSQLQRSASTAELQTQLTPLSMFMQLGTGPASVLRLTGSRLSVGSLDGLFVDSPAHMARGLIPDDLNWGLQLPVDSADLRFLEQLANSELGAGPTSTLSTLARSQMGSQSAGTGLNYNAAPFAIKQEPEGQSPLTRPAAAASFNGAGDPRGYNFPAASYFSQSGGMGYLGLSGPDAAGALSRMCDTARQQQVPQHPGPAVVPAISGGLYMAAAMAPEAATQGTLGSGQQTWSAGLPLGAPFDMYSSVPQSNGCDPAALHAALSDPWGAALAAFTLPMEAHGRW